MLHFANKGSYLDNNGYSWDYYRDDQMDPNPDPNAFYIIPKPNLAAETNGDPSFQILHYETDGADNGSGYLTFAVELTVPDNVKQGVTADIKANPVKFPNVTQPVFISLPINTGSKASFELNTEGVNTTYTAPAADFGGNLATFMISLTKAQLDTVTAAFSGSGGAIAVTYALCVPARLQDVSAVLSFDSSIAYQYQVTQPTYNQWGHEVSSGSVSKMLNDSASSKVNIVWGIPNPPSTLVDSVTNWANKTLADLVTAEVQKAIAVQGLQSNDSFSINEVSSFITNFTDNMVVNWPIAPKAIIPAIPDWNSKSTAFLRKVNEQKQLMIVSTNLPFADDLNSHPKLIPTVQQNNVLKKAYVQNVVVTIQYPTLPQGVSTFMMKSNQSKCSLADFDSSHGPSWNLLYQVNYSDPEMPVVSNTIKDIPAGTYILKLEEAGILSVIFDATQVFSGEGTRPAEIDIHFSYINGVEPMAAAILQTIKILHSDLPLQKTIYSLQSMPISTTYNFNVDYIYPLGVKYSAPLVQNQNASLQVLNSANVIHPVNIIAYFDSTYIKDNLILDVNVNVWYAQPPTLPPGAVSNQPTESSPAVFHIPLTSVQGGLMGKTCFEGLLYGDQPLVYSASLSTANGQKNINAQQLQNSQASIMITPTQLYYTLQISPASIDWNTAGYTSVAVLINIAIAQGTAPRPVTNSKNQFLNTWNKGEIGSKYITCSLQEGNVVTYDTEVRYIAPGNADKIIKSTGQKNILFEIPAWAVVFTQKTIA